MSRTGTSTIGVLLRRYRPILTWGAEYSRQTLASDLVAAAIVTIMLIPQSLAYALLVIFLTAHRRFVGAKAHEQPFSRASMSQAH